MRIFALPDLGEGLHEAEIVEWRVAPGDEVVADQIVAAVETDKALVEIPAPWPGRIEKLFGKPGDTIRVGAPFIGFAGEPADAGTVVGELAVAAPPGTSEAPGAAREPRAAPAVRALARRLGVALADVVPTGPEGTVSAEDVERAAAARAGGAPLRGMLRTMARNMARAHAEVAAVTVTDDVDIDAWPDGCALMPRLVRALVAAARAEPALNAWYDPERASRRTFAEVHVGIAVDTPEGLVVPVLRNCEARAGAALAADIDALVAQARARRLAPEALRGATILLSNYGAIAGRYATPIVVPPAVAIVGAGRIARRAVVLADGRIAAHRVLPISLTFDHRAATGGEAGRFLAALVEDLARAD
ncbi:MAG: 2-oxo acid dehydrogenase subunit E2 [Burkholderiales bacterium]|nr:2-oxo acid dehydrogenase subunit E2 [Burkholderiales bacterium]